MPSSNRYTRFIPREEIGDVMRWEFGDVHGADTLRPLVPPRPLLVDEPAPTADDAAAQAEQAEQQALLQQAHDEGHARGLAEGEQQARLAAQQQMDDYIAGQGREAAARLAAVAQALETSLAGLQQAMAQEVLQLACDIARQVLRQELQSSPRALLPVVREALATFVQESRPAVVRLHPDDWAVLESALREAFGAARVQWLPDASVTAGGCRVECAGAVLDATLETRWQRAIAALGLVSAWREMGDEH